MRSCTAQRYDSLDNVHNDGGKPSSKRRRAVIKLHVLTASRRYQWSAIGLVDAQEAQHSKNPWAFVEPSGGALRAPSGGTHRDAHSHRRCLQARHDRC